MPLQTDQQGNPIVTPTGNTITTTASNILRSSASSAVDIASGTASVIVGGAGSVVGGVIGSAVSAVAQPVIQAATQINTVVELAKNPSLGGALALLGRGFPPYRNELDQFASYTTIFTLACLTNFELNFPLSYRTVGPLLQIIRSGGTAGKKVPTIYETDGQVEFFIDDVNIECYVAPNSRSRHSNAMGITFKVTEPYSMGQFFHNLRTAALIAGHTNYLEAPFLLGIEFIGYDDQGNVKAPFFAKRYIPMAFIGIDMNVTEAGAVYDCQAIPYNEIALTNANRSTQTDVDIRGTSVGEILQSGPGSLTSVINETMLRLQQSGQVIAADQYVISFPRGDFSLSSIVQEVTPVSSVTTNATGRQQLYQALTGVSGGAIPPEFDQKLQELNGFSVPRTALGEAVRAEANNSALWNSIGSSKIVKSFLDGGSQPFGEPSFVEIEGVEGQFQRGSLQMSDLNRRFTFKAGESIEEIIQEVILSSEYGRRLTSQTPDATGKVNWFRIETQVFNVTNPIASGQLGRSPRIFVYRVVPFKVDSSKIEGPSTSIFKTLARQTQAIKAYNYIYTGQNNDIIDFDIKFDIAFFSNLATDRGQMRRDNKNPGGIAADTPDPTFRTNTGTPTPAGTEGRSRINNTPVQSSGQRGGGAREHVENSVARMFNEAILNTDNDLINVKLKINGDPFYIVDAGVGNYLGLSNPVHSAITLEGSMNPRNGEVDVILNFRTPIDYDGEDGFVKYPLGGFVPVAMFSGVYQVILVNNTFVKGQFIQELELVRKRGQDLTLESLAASAVSFFNDAKSMVQGTPANQIDEKDGGYEI